MVAVAALKDAAALAFVTCAKVSRGWVESYGTIGKIIASIMVHKLKTYFDVSYCTWGFDL